ncbi:MAG: PhoH family protein [Gammaproteobacteria bacterium]|nr:PhoH family protein [Gammaproteobacteria bacterium]MCY4219005.1 PhoH family protein [Gammaproteobacteria bacterium]MCY4275623.1 PhoH family protein [Gammaproteobacteria bacterium]
MTQLINFELLPAENDRLSSLCGQMNCHIKHIEENLQVRIVNRSNRFSISGSENDSEQAATVVKRLFEMTKNRSQPISPGDVALALSALGDDRISEDGCSVDDSDTGTEDEEVILNLRKNVIRGHNHRQRLYLKNIRDHDINFGIGPAGTGKTYLAVASAVDALSRNEIERILLVRPAVEAGEKLGFLPGDIGQKIDPYLRPLFDALYQMLGFERVGKLIARSTIELAPLAYMRGRTLNDSFVILDEAQNSTVEQMKMFLTRIGFNSKAVVTGDITQIDLARDQLSGLKHAHSVLKNVKGIRFIHFKPQDVVRHPLVQRIVEAYEQHPSDC